MGERRRTRISCLAPVHSDGLGSMGGRPTIQRRRRLAAPVDLVVLASDIKRCSGTLTIERVRRLTYHGVEDGRGNASYASGSAPPSSPSLGNMASIGAVDTIDFVSLSMTTSLSLYYSFCASSDDLRSPRKRFFLNCDPRPRQKYNPPGLQFYKIVSGHGVALGSPRQQLTSSESAVWPSTAILPSRQQGHHILGAN